MKKEDAITRRSFLSHTASAASAVSLFALLGCDDTEKPELYDKETSTPVGGGQPATGSVPKGKVQCDASKLSEQDLAPRAALGYVDASPQPNKNCANCKLFIAEGGGCSGCTLFPGPVDPDGYCNSWVAA